MFEALALAMVIGIGVMIWKMTRPGPPTGTSGDDIARPPVDKP